MIEISQTLSQRVAEGGMPSVEALRLARELADALRRIHDAGRTQGVLTPDTVVLTSEGIQLLAAPEGAVEEPSPYAAPELSQGHPPDACSDVFTFGATLYQMLTGCPPDGSPLPQLDEPGLDRLVSTCLAPDRSDRWQRMQQVVTGLRLLSASARRAETGGMTPYHQIATSMGSEIGRLEKALAEGLQEHGKTMFAQLCATDEEMSRRQSASLQAISNDLTAMRAQFSGAENDLAAVAADIRELKETVKGQAAAIDLARSATTRTDELVEGVVDALESLQNLLLDQMEVRQVAGAR
jgi:serine/threonine protein kinase